MAYGLTASSVMLAQGVPPAMASAGVHAAEVVTTALSGAAHWRLGHVIPRLVLRLAVPGVVGGVFGALVASELPMHLLKPAVSFYLVIMGVIVLRRAVMGRRPDPSLATRDAAPIGFGGGFLDAVGGGGWGPVVTTSLLGSGMDPRTTIGSVNFAEFFLTIASATSFILLAGEPNTWTLVAGLVLGGLFAAPFAALLCARLSAKTLLTMVGCLITFISAYNLYTALG